MYRTMRERYIKQETLYKIVRLHVYLAKKTRESRHLHFQKYLYYMCERHGTLNEKVWNTRETQINVYMD